MARGSGWVAAAAFVVAPALASIGCESTTSVPDDGPAVRGAANVEAADTDVRPGAAAPAPGAFTFELGARDAAFEAAARELAPLVAAQYERASRLEQLESRASFELRGEVVDGGFEQCEGDVFLAAGGRGAIRLTKLGDNLAWIGGDAGRSWVFTFRDGRCEARVFRRLISAHARLTPGAEPKQGEPDLVLLTPESVRILAGLAPLPKDMMLARVPDAPASGAIRERFEIRWNVGPAVVAALRFGADGLPAGVVLRRDGVEIARSETSNYVRARIDAVAEGAWPSVPRRIRILAPQSGADLRVFLDEPAAQSRRMKPRFFDLAELQKQFMPETIEYVEADGSTAGSPDDESERTSDDESERTSNDGSGRTSGGPRAGTTS